MVAIGCGEQASDTRILSSQEVGAAFERAGLPLADFLADVESCDPDPLDLDKPDGPGVEIIDASCTFAEIESGSGRQPPYALFYPRDGGEFYVAVYTSAEKAESVEAAGAPVRSNYVTSPRDVVRVSNVLAVVQPAEDALAERIREILEDL